MAANPPTNPKSSREEQAATPAALTLEEKLNQFWQKNRMVVLALCAFVLVAILAKGWWEHHQLEVEQEIGAAYQAATTPEQLKAFIAAHPGHSLAGIAELRMADDAYTAGKSTDAIAGYDRAIAILQDPAIIARAKVGRALAKIQGGKSAEATTELQAIANDTNQFTAARTEAAYQLTILAIDAGNFADANKYIQQLEEIDPASVRARQALQLRASLPAVAAAAVPAAPASAKTDSGPKVEVNLPKK